MEAEMYLETALYVKLSLPAGMIHRQFPRAFAVDRL